MPLSCPLVPRTLVPSLWICLLAALAPPLPADWFAEVSDAAGFTHAGESYGASWGDFNGDGYPDLFLNNHREWPALYRNEGDGTFRNVILSADGSGIWKGDEVKRDTHGASFADVDGDGDRDLYVTTGGGYDGALLLNENNVLFDRGIAANAFQDVEGRFPVWLDHNRDGRLDVAFMIRSASRVLQQRGGDTLGFSQVTEAVGLDCTGMDFGQLSDLNADGVAELVCGNGTYPRRIYDLTTLPFGDLTTLMPFVSRGTDAAIADFDGDLDPDVFVIAGKKELNDIALIDERHLEAYLGVSPAAEAGFTVATTGELTVNVHIRRQLDDADDVFIGTAGLNPPAVPFTLDPTDPATHGIQPHDPSLTGGVWIGWIPESGHWQVLVSGPDDGTAGAYFEVASTAPITGTDLLLLEPGDLPERPYLLDNLGDGQGFVERGEDRGLTAPVQCVSLTSGDFDNDMDVDVYAVCRRGVLNIANRLYENLGDGSFRVVEGHGAEGVLGFHLADRAGLGDSAVTADYDLDGCLDLFVTNGLPLRPLRHDSGPDQLFRNACDQGNHWLALDLVGAGEGASNPEGLGARVIATVDGIAQLREQGGGYHRWSQSHSRLHFGLGGYPQLDELRVLWPSGLEEVFTAVAADRQYVLHEGTGELAVLSTGGGGFPAPGPADACGEPDFDAGLHGALFVYQDCDSGVWSVRATAGATLPSAEFIGSLVADQPFSTVTPYLLEGGDRLDTTLAGQIDFTLAMSSGGRDGFEFALPAGATACLEAVLPPGLEVLVGAGSLPAPVPLALDTLGPCAPPPGLTVADLSVDEGEGAARFLLTLDAAAASDLVVDYVLRDGTARLDEDYLGGAGSVRIPAGEHTWELPVPVIDDSTAEGPETFEVVLLGAAPARIVDGTAQATILDNERNACGKPVFDASTLPGLYLWRDCPDATWQLRLSGGGGDRLVAQGELTAESPFAVAPQGESFEGADSVTLSDAQTIAFAMHVVGWGQDTLRFTAPTTGATCLATVAGSDPVTLYLGVARTPVSLPVALDGFSDCRPVPELSVADITAGEGDGVAVFNLSLSAPYADTVSVDFRTVDGEARAGEDYTAAAGTAVIAAGEPGTEVLIELLNDPLVEGPERFALQLEGAINARLRTATAQATLEDDEPYPCGEPVIDAAAEGGVFLWRDCVSGVWSLRVTAGGPDKVRHQGELQVSEGLDQPPVPFSTEGADRIELLAADRLSYSLNVIGSGLDGFDLILPNAGGACLTLDAPADTQIQVGEPKRPVGRTFDLNALAACAP